MKIEPHPVIFGERFISKFVIENECWVWKGAKNRKGYGVIRLRDKNMLAHRVAWIKSKYDIPNGLYVLHKCDNPSCVNPNHLFLGTPKDNMDDKMKKGREVKGENHGGSKLTEENVKEIRNLYTKGRPGQVNEFSLRKLAKRYGVNSHTIFNIVNNNTWKDIS